MIFSNFNRTEVQNKIIFKNVYPIENIEELKFFKDNSNGTFIKKEFRWSFDNVYWSSWEDLNQGNFTNIQIKSTNLFFEVRYTISSSASTVTLFSIYYTEIKSSVNLFQPIPSLSTQIDASKLNGFDGEYYLYRNNHKGAQAISTITGLNNILTNITNGIQNTIVDGSTIAGSGIELFYEKNNRILYFKRLNSGNGVSLSETNGIITIDASLVVVKDPSIDNLYEFCNSLESSLYDLSIYIDSKFLQNDSSISDSFNHNLLINKDSSSAHPQYLLEASLGPSFLYETSLGIDFADFVYFREKKDITGFVDPSNIVINYDSSERTITLTGTGVRAFRNSIEIDISSGWVSSPHPNTNGSWFLTYGDNGFTWSQTPWDYFDIQIAYIYYNTINRFAIRECHTFMHWETHREFHEIIGTYRTAGGDLSDYTLSSTTPIERRPLISSTYVKDEDLLTTVNSLSTELYTQIYLDASGTFSFTVDASDIVPLNGNIPYYNEFTGSIWQQTPITNNYYMPIWVIAVPVTSDVLSQKYRYLFLQGQEINSSLSIIQNLSSQNLNLGNLSSLFTEFVFFKKIIIRYIGGNWQLIEIQNITGNRVTQITSATGSFLTVVNTDNTLGGNGTSSNPLYLADSSAYKFESILVACSGENEDLTVDTSVATFIMPFNFYLNELIASVKYAPATSPIAIDINKNNISILGNLLYIDAGNLNSLDSSIQYTIIDPSIGKGDIITIDVDQIGISSPGKGNKVILNGIRI